MSQESTDHSTPASGAPHATEAPASEGSPRPFPSPIPHLPPLPMSLSHSHTQRNHRQGVQAKGPTPVPRPPTKLRDADTQSVWEAECAVRHAEVNKLVTLLRYIDAKTEQTRREWREAYERLESREAPTEQLRLCAQMAEDAIALEERAAIMYAADALNCSEHQVLGLQMAALRARAHLPRVWRAFRAGRITTLALRRITGALDKALKQKTVEGLDAEAPEVAERLRPGQLSSWLQRFVAQAEPDGAAERFTRAAKERYVSVKDIEDGMSLLTAVMPTLTAHSIKQKLEAAARSPKQAVPHNPLIATQVHQQEQRLELTHALHQWMTSGRSDEDPQRPTTHAESWEIGRVAQEMARNLQERAEQADRRGSVQSPTSLHITDGAPIGLPAAADQEQPEAEVPPGQDSGIGVPETREDGDPRTIHQRAVDMLTAWLLSGNSVNGIETEAHIGILVPEATLAGTSDQPAITRDGRAVIPGPHIRDMLRIQSNKLTWYELDTGTEPDDPSEKELPEEAAHGENILAFRSVGRYPPPRLRTALLFRDGTCRAGGCQTPAELCDIDHITPWPLGPTTADNLQVLCRRHHRLKTAGHNIGSDYIEAA